MESISQRENGSQSWNHSSFVNELKYSETFIFGK